MRKAILELGFEDNAEIEDEVAKLVTDEIAGRSSKSEVEVYEKIVEEAYVWVNKHAWEKMVNMYLKLWSSSL